MSRDCIAIVLDEAFGKKMRPLVRDSYLWAVHSHANRDAAESLWRELGEVGVTDMVVSIGEPVSDSTSRDAIEELVDSAIEHFGHIDRIDIYPASGQASSAFDAIMEERNFDRMDEIAAPMRYSR